MYVAEVMEINWPIMEALTNPSILILFSFSCNNFVRYEGAMTCVGVSIASLMMGVRCDFDASFYFAFEMSHVGIQGDGHLPWESCSVCVHVPPIPGHDQRQRVASKFRTTQVIFSMYFHINWTSFQRFLIIKAITASSRFVARFSSILQFITPQVASCFLAVRRAWRLRTGHFSNPVHGPLQRKLGFCQSLASSPLWYCGYHLDDMACKSPSQSESGWTMWNNNNLGQRWPAILRVKTVHISKIPVAGGNLCNLEVSS